MSLTNSDRGCASDIRQIKQEDAPPARIQRKKQYNVWHIGIVSTDRTPLQRRISIGAVVAVAMTTRFTAPLRHCDGERNLS